MYESIRFNIQSKIKAKLSDQDFAAFTARTQLMEWRKKETLIREGQYCQYLFFVNKGLLYSSYTSEEGMLHVIQIAYEDFWISDLYSFFSGQPAMYEIKALEPTTVIAITKDHFEQICKTSPVFERFFRILIQNAYVASQHGMTQNKSMDAETRYRSLLDKHPDILQRVPQYLVASFLGIQPQSLSRIRTKMLRK